MATLHEIDKPEGGYSKRAVESFMIFCILDTCVPYEKVCEAYDALKKNGLVWRNKLKQKSVRDIELILKSTGYRWSHQKAVYLKDFANNDINLLEASRDEIVKSVKGVGMKLASMFLRNTRGHKYAVLDVHTLRWLQNNYKYPDKVFNKMSYEEKEKAFIEAASFLGKDPRVLDLEIWEKMRIGNRK